jgi:HPt (histidine-containing phosphotransfer) domain-containing protein
MGNEELVSQILDKLRTAVAVERNRLQDACREQDFVTAARIAHRLKGTAANVEAAALRQAAERLEVAARTQDARALAAAIRPLEDECRRLGECAAQYHET